jgi:hypothetical protein
LLYLLPKYLNGLEKDPNVSEEHRKVMGNLKALIRSDHILPTDLLQFKEIF